MKRVLIVCTGNSCRSIMAEAIINSYLSINGVEAFSCGSNPKSRIDPFTQQLLEERGVYIEKSTTLKVVKSLEMKNLI